MSSTTRETRADQQPDELHHEQSYLSMLYGRLDALRDRTNERLAEVTQQQGGTPQARSQRDNAIGEYTAQQAQLNAVEQGLCFGRLDLLDGSRRYIGRIGLFNADGDYEPLLLDWRAPAARAFYLATATSPEGVRRRRHIRTRGRQVVRLDDEVLDLSRAREAAQTPGARDSSAAAVTGEAALLAALDAGRTGRMRDIVATIQAEQDVIIRAELSGTLVVQGGPGTGKTAVALHRAAYLLYTHRQQLSTRGVLIVGPNETFLRYISHVLPSLAETGVLLRTVGDLFPGVSARRAEPAAVAEIKGRPQMAQVLAAAVQDRQEVPDETIEIELEQETLRLDPHTCRAARLRARRTGRPHNLARTAFDTEIVHALAQQISELIGTDPYADDPLGGDDAPGDPRILDEADEAEIRRELRATPAVRQVLDRLWPILTPRQLLTDLFASADRLATAAPQLTEAERAALLRQPGPVRHGWTPADAPLLDEAAELLGEPEPTDDPAERERRARIAYAEGALEIAEGSRSIDTEDEDEPELLTAADLLHAAELAERHEDRDTLTAAQRAAADRSWAFGHVIVDEAQELSAMAWRMVMRRCPSRSMTLVGDLAQTGDLAGASSWGEMLAPYVADRWRLARLTVNYRTPAEVMAVAARVLHDIDPALEPPQSVRATGVAPWRIEVCEGLLAERLAELVRRDLAELDEGRIGVIVPDDRLVTLTEALRAAAGPATAPDGESELDAPVAVLNVRQAKGLEFDRVIVVDPDGLVAQSPRGRNDLYVALTRATQRLGELIPTRP